MCDVKALQKVLSVRHLIYQHQYNKQMSCPAMAQFSCFQTHFITNASFLIILSMSWVALTMKERDVSSHMMLLVPMSSQGSGSTLIMPFLDNQLKSPSPLLLPAKDAV